MQKFKNFVLQFWQVKFWDFEKISPKRHKKIARKSLFSKKYTTERSEVSQKSKRRYFANNQNDNIDFSLSTKAQNDKNNESINHFIPFNAGEVADGSFLSDFMYKFINGKFGKNGTVSSLRASKSERGNPQNKDRDCHEVAPTSRNDGADNLFGDELKPKSFIPTKPLKFSKEAKAVFDAGREIWLYYHKHAKNDQKYNENASLYDIKEHFQGRNEKGRMNARSDDETYNGLMANLRLALKELAIKITPKIYEYGFLRE